MPSVTSIIHPYKDKHGKQKVQIMVVWGRSRIYLKTDIKIIPGTESEKVKALIRKKVAETEDKLHDAIRDGLTPQQFKNSLKQEKAKSILLTDYIATLTERLKGRMSQNTLRHYTSLGNKLPGVYLSEINVPFLERFESSLALDSNTIFANTKRLKSILYKAERDGLIKKEQFEKYRVPAYKQKLPQYLTEAEIDSFTKVLRPIKDHCMKVGGWYYLLSYYTGWRISDARKYTKDLIEGDRLVLRAQKNGEIVSIVLFPKLLEVLKVVNKLPFDVSEKRVRACVKDIARLAGIKKHVKYHSSRHGFAMLLMSKGFTVDEVAHFLGDSILIAKVYARVHNESLDKKIRERLG